MAEKYLIPYNEKIWNVPAEELGLEWVEGRVPKPPVEDVIKAAVGVETEGYTHQLYFDYPTRGGIESLPLAMGSKVEHIVTGFNVQKIWKERRGWCVSDGRSTRRYDSLAATIPMHELVRAVEGVPREINAAVQSLRYNCPHDGVDRVRARQDCRITRLCMSLTPRSVSTGFRFPRCSVRIMRPRASR